MGEIAARKLIERINNPYLPIEHISLPGNLVERAYVREVNNQTK